MTKEPSLPHYLFTHCGEEEIDYFLAQIASSMILTKSPNSISYDDSIYRKYTFIVT